MQEASEALETCGTALRGFAEAVYAQEDVVTAPDGNTGALDPETLASALKKRKRPRDG